MLVVVVMDKNGETKVGNAGCQLNPGSRFWKDKALIVRFTPSASQEGK